MDLSESIQGARPELYYICIGVNLFVKPYTLRGDRFTEHKADPPSTIIRKCGTMSKILVVDDVPSELEIICRILLDVGLEVIRAANGEEAIARIREKSPDLVVLDVVMPRMNGFEVIRELRGDRKTAKLPVVFCTHKSTDIDKAWGTDLGADAYLSKPFEPQQLVNIVQRLLSA